MNILSGFDRTCLRNLHGRSLCIYHMDGCDQGSVSIGTDAYFVTSIGIEIALSQWNGNLSDYIPTMFGGIFCISELVVQRAKALIV